MKLRELSKLNMDDRLRNYLIYYGLIIYEYENKYCATCIHRKSEEYKICNRHDKLTFKCSEYEKDLKVEENAFKIIKEFILNEYKED